jgi:hypothetical protein
MSRTEQCLETTREAVDGDMRATGLYIARASLLVSITVGKRGGPVLIVPRPGEQRPQTHTALRDIGTRHFANPD